MNKKRINQKKKYIYINSKNRKNFHCFGWHTAVEIHIDHVLGPIVLYKQ